MSLYYGDNDAVIPGPRGPSIGTNHRIAARPFEYSWMSDADWNAWTTVPVSDTSGHTISKTAADGVGTITGTSAGTGNDRRLFTRPEFQARDMEVHALVDINDNNHQIGLGLRAVPGKHVAVWSNVTFNTSGIVLGGVWEYASDALLQTNLAANSTQHGIDVLNGTSSGGVVTLNTRFPHNLRVGDIVDASAVNAGFGLETITDVPTSDSFKFSDATVGPFGSGTILPTFMPLNGVHIAARILGNRLLYKVWYEETEPEPSWGSATRCVSNIIPATLASGAQFQTGKGTFGVIAAHLGSGGAVNIRDLYAISLD